MLLHTSRNAAVCFTCPSRRYSAIVSVVDHATPLGEQESNLPLLSICFIQHIILGGFGESQPASTPKSSFAPGVMYLMSAGLEPCIMHERAEK